MSTAVAIFVKTPGLSPVKTRLANDIGVENAERFHRMAAAAVAEVVAAQVGVEPYWAVAEPHALGHPMWREFPTIRQGPGGLGARLNKICCELQSRYGRVLMIGADAPQISGKLLNQACDALDKPDSPHVLGRATDGGFWLFGTRIPIAGRVWQSVTYSRDDTADQLFARLRQHGNVALLPTLTDADRGGDLSALIAALNALPSPLPAQLMLCEWLYQRCPATHGSVSE